MDRLTRGVREQLALGRLLPLGEAEDAVWITESAAVRALRRAVAGMSGVRLREVEVLPADPDEAEVPAVAPAGALPHLPVRVEAAFDAAADEPLPLTAQRLRDVLWEAAAEGVGLAVAAVDLRITGLLEDVPALPPGEVVEGVVLPEPEEIPPVGAPDAPAAVGAAAAAVLGVRRLTRRLAGLGPGVRVRDLPETAPMTRQVQVQIAVAAGHKPLVVARAVVAAVASAAAPGAPGPVEVAVVVTDVG
ncbi:nucleopolyhedrovirus P10 family protein [Streptomyces polygonati]|uniref:Nucleopolyhedrovirus P10 family protein n=1 Tax=Streptomyces polygonati TaxID=1617087 RepID=A0ABV8HF11_9ACTN